MKRLLSCRRIGITVFCIAASAALFGYIQLQLLHMRAAFAEDQIAVFYSMTSKSLKANTANAASNLCYVVEYYPSGTKQIKGTHLDRIVESARQHCVQRIIDHMRFLTNADLGDDPDLWVRRYAPGKLGGQTKGSGSQIETLNHGGD